MPLYDYDCAACGRRFEVVHGVHAERPTSCPICGSGPIRKAISAPAVHFKGSGWAKKERRVTPAASRASGDGGSSDGGSSDGGSSAGDSSHGSSSDGGSSDGGSSEAAAKANGATDASSSSSKAAARAKPVETGSAAKGD
jgi:putative FmdB family regulatory protein